LNYKALKARGMEISYVTSWKKLLSGYKLLKATLREVGATASLRMSADAMLKAVKILYSAHAMQGSPT